MNEDAPPYGITLDGVPVVLSGEHPPATPVISIVPAESFDPAGRPFSWAYKRSLVRRSSLGLPGTNETCDPNTAVETCDTQGGSSSWSPPANAVYQRGIGIREIAAFLRTPNDHEPWDKGAPEFRLFIAGTSDTDSDAELAARIDIPEGAWAGSDDTANAEWRLFDPLVLADWDTDYGNRVELKCMEEDFDLFGNMTVKASGSTTIQGITVSFAASWTLNDSSDDCGEFALLVRTSTGEWTRIPDARLRGTLSEQSDGTTDLRWTGYGVSLVP